MGRGWRQHTGSGIPSRVGEEHRVDQGGEANGPPAETAPRGEHVGDVHRRDDNVSGNGVETDGH